jgi:hypothetical protein
LTSARLAADEEVRSNRLLRLLMVVGPASQQGGWLNSIAQSFELHQHHVEVLPSQSIHQPMMRMFSRDTRRHGGMGSCQEGSQVKQAGFGRCVAGATLRKRPGLLIAILKAKCSPYMAPSEEGPGALNTTGVLALHLSTGTARSVGVES